MASWKQDQSHNDRVIASAQEAISRLARDGDTLQPETASSISSGLSIIGKIIGDGALTIFGRVEGEVHASNVVIAEGAEMLGDVVAQDLTVRGHVKGNIRGNRVKLNSTGVVEGDIFHGTLAIDENARFEGASRRNKNVIETLRTFHIRASHACTYWDRSSAAGRKWCLIKVSTTCRPVEKCRFYRHQRLRKDPIFGNRQWIGQHPVLSPFRLGRSIL
jgi:cytoskeletal protein CcmA (bactofilin family)